MSRWSVEGHYFWLASRYLNKDAIVLLHKASPHALEHAKKIAIKCFAAEALKSAPGDEAEKAMKKRKRAEWLQVIEGPDCAGVFFEVLAAGNVKMFSGALNPELLLHVPGSWL